jgi:hypothetical protein
MQSRLTQQRERHGTDSGPVPTGNAKHRHVISWNACCAKWWLDMVEEGRGVDILLHDLANPNWD